jgi:hypothetical protein
LTVLNVVGEPTLSIPVTTQLVEVAQEIADRDNTEGAFSNDHVLPSWVPTIAGEPLTKPTPIQFVDPLHETLDSELSPVGEVCGLQVDPFVVFRIDDVPPTAVHWELVVHEIDWAANDAFSTVHVTPASVDFRMPDPPPA